MIVSASARGTRKRKDKRMAVSFTAFGCPSPALLPVFTVKGCLPFRFPFRPPRGGCVAHGAHPGETFSSHAAMNGISFTGYEEARRRRNPWLVPGSSRFLCFLPGGSCLPAPFPPSRTILLPDRRSASQSSPLVRPLRLRRVLVSPGRHPACCAPQP